MAILKIRIGALAVLPDYGETHTERGIGPIATITYDGSVIKMAAKDKEMGENIMEWIDLSKKKENFTKRFPILSGEFPLSEAYGVAKRIIFYAQSRIETLKTVGNERFILSSSPVFILYKKDESSEAKVVITEDRERASRDWLIFMSAYHISILFSEEEKKEWIEADKIQPFEPEERRRGRERHRYSDDKMVYDLAGFVSGGWTSPEKKELFDRVIQRIWNDDLAGLKTE